MAIDSLYPNLLTFSAVGFTIFISGAVARYTLLKDVRINRWYFKIYKKVLSFLPIPGILLAISPTLILFSYAINDMLYALIGFYTILAAYTIFFFYIPFGFIIGYAYLALENHFYHKFQKEL